MRRAPGAAATEPGGFPRLPEGARLTRVFWRVSAPARRLDWWRWSLRVAASSGQSRSSPATVAYPDHSEASSRSDFCRYQARSTRPCCSSPASSWRPFTESRSARPGAVARLERRDGHRLGGRDAAMPAMFAVCCCDRVALARPNLSQASAQRAGRAARAAAFGGPLRNSPGACGACSRLPRAVGSLGSPSMRSALTGRG